MRTQYHLRRTPTGIDAWHVGRLIRLSQGLAVDTIDPKQIRELHQDHWYFHDPTLQPTPQSLVQHMRLINAADLRYPVILDSQGRLMDGMHRVCKAILVGINQIPAVQFQEDPLPDLVNCDPGRLHDTEHG